MTPPTLMLLSALYVACVILLLAFGYGANRWRCPRCGRRHDEP